MVIGMLRHGMSHYINLIIDYNRYATVLYIILGTKLIFNRHGFFFGFNVFMCIVILYRVKCLWKWPAARGFTNITVPLIFNLIVIYNDSGENYVYIFF